MHNCIYYTLISSYLIKNNFQESLTAFKNFWFRYITKTTSNKKIYLQRLNVKNKLLYLLTILMKS